jgi:tRNA (guanine37-N1)-methyltransferase
MILKAEPLAACVEAIRTPEARVILLDPAGRHLTQAVARELAGQPHLVLVCGRYEGVDERFREQMVDDELSIGDYVLTGGELPALVVVDAVARLVPGVVGDAASVVADSFTGGLLDHPQYTRPAVWRGHQVPEVLVSGHHKEIERWRRQQRVRRTRARRPDLLAGAALTAEEREDVGAAHEGLRRERRSEGHEGD